MIVEFGHFALVLALVVALVQATLPLAGAAWRQAPLIALAAPAALMQFGLIALSFMALTQAFVASDFSVAAVVANSHSMKPLLYKVSGVWGNHEGSMLLWVLILALFGALVALFGGNLPPTLKARVLAVQSMIAVGFLLFMLLTSNPFARVFPPPPDGNDLNPLLQDPGLAFHPPMLYVGYVGFSIVFSFAAAALIEGKVDAAWARWVRPWTLLAWSFMTAGIALGSWWAYYELGWGGWWYWDPVENASFMPWLVGTALLHSAIVVEKRDALKSWTILLAILTFSLSLIGTFLVRSGVLTSVHAFATDPDRGVFILGLLVVAVGGSLLLYAWRAPTLQGGGLFAPVSREGALLLNNLIMVTAAGTVFLGTLYPLFLEAIDGSKVSVGPPFFNATFVPLMLPMLAALGVGPLLSWKRGDLAGVLGRLRLALALAGIVALATLLLKYGQDGYAAALAAIGLGLAAWLAGSILISVQERAGFGRTGALRRLLGLPRAFWGMTLAHLGLAIAVVGITGVSLWQSERVLAMRPGDAAEIAGYRVVFEGVGGRDGPNYRAVQGRFRLEDGTGRHLAMLLPERRRYVVGGVETTEAAIRSTVLADVYAVIGAADDKGAHTVRLYHKPLVPWIWMGALVMVVGGVVSLTDRRLRIGAPARTRAAAPLPPVESAVEGTAGGVVR